MKKTMEIHRYAAEFICGIDSIIYNDKTLVREGNYTMFRDFIRKFSNRCPDAINLIYYKDQLICRSISNTHDEIAEIIEDKDNHEELVSYINNATNREDLLKLLNIKFDESLNSYALRAKTEIEKIAREITEEYYHDLLS